jgi:hypothetical protein
VLWEWSRSDDAALRVSSCGVIRGLVLESPPAIVYDIQRSALDWGAFLWHVNASVDQVVRSESHPVSVSACGMR